MSLITCLSLVLVALMTMVPTFTAAKEVMKLPNDQVLMVTHFQEGTLRAKVQPASGDFYRVTDVVVLDKNPSETLVVACESESECVVSTGIVKLTASVTLGDAPVLKLQYFVHEVLTTTTQIPLSVKDAPEATTFFHRATKLYGLPQHAMDLTLKHDVTYQLYNLDVFHYKLDDPGGIYGSIPFMMAHGAEFSTGVLFLNSAEMNVRILKPEESSVPAAHWKCEVGIVDLTFFPGPNPHQLHRQHADFTGHTMLPPSFALGYHQCRWNYRSSDDCLAVDDGFDKHNIPYDVLWLDIEHTDGKKYFTWDLHNFPEPQKLINAIAAKGRKMVTIKDPHVKREAGYHVHDEATSKGFYVKTESGSDYEGHCWPGTSSWVDYYNKNAREWYATMFKHDRYSGSTPDLYTWIDMNEPSVFNSHQVTMDRNAVHRSASGKQVKHRYLHNMYGYYHTMSVYDGHILSSEGKPSIKRPFILTRSFFSGSQRYAAMWTGDNMAKWDHLEKSIPMLLSLSVGNYPFTGADCGGFFFNPEADLMVRWFQAGIFYPFFRGHAHLETKRREPWLFGEDATRRMQAAIALRYSLLPYLYTTFFTAHATGNTIIRPLFYEFPQESQLFDEQNTYMFGPSLLVSPVVKENELFHTVHLPTGAQWYDYFTGERVTEAVHTVSVTMDTIPLYARGGHIIPTKQRLRRSSSGMRNDPLTLYVALNEKGESYGEWYIDDEDTFDYQQGAFVHRAFSYSEGRLRCQKVSAAVYTPASNEKASTFKPPTAAIERIVIFGLASEPKRVVSVPAVETSNNGVVVASELSWKNVQHAIVIRQPKVSAYDEWEILIE